MTLIIRANRKTYYYSSNCWTCCESDSRYPAAIVSIARKPMRCSALERWVLPGKWKAPLSGSNYPITWRPTICWKVGEQIGIGAVRRRQPHETAAVAQSRLDKEPRKRVIPRQRICQSRCFSLRTRRIRGGAGPSAGHSEYYTVPLYVRCANRVCIHSASRCVSITMSKHL